MLGQVEAEGMVGNKVIDTTSVVCETDNLYAIQCYPWDYKQPHVSEAELCYIRNWPSHGALPPSQKERQQAIRKWIDAMPPTNAQVAKRQRLA